MSAPSPQPVSLLVVTAFGARLGGSDNILWSYLRNVDRTRVDPIVVFLQRGPFVEEVAELGMRTYVLPAGRLRHLGHLMSTTVRLARLMRKLRPDLILNWLSTAQVSSGPAAWLARMNDRTLWWQLDLHTGGRLSRGRLIDQIATAIPSMAVGACSEATASNQRLLRPRRPVITILPGIPEPTKPAQADLESRRMALGLAPEIPVVGSIGRLFEWKGHHRLLSAVELLNHRGVPCQALIVGGGGHRGDLDYERELHAMAQRPALASKAAFTGQVPDGTAYLGLMDVFVNCSHPEPFGLVVVEAMASETVAVAVDAGGPREIIEPGRSGLLARSGTSKDLAAAIEPVLRDEGLRRRLAEGGRRRFEAAFREAQMAETMTDTLEHIVR